MTMQASFTLAALLRFVIGFTLGGSLPMTAAGAEKGCGTRNMFKVPGAELRLNGTPNRGVNALL